MRIMIMLVVLATAVAQSGCEESCTSSGTNPGKSPYVIAIDPANFVSGQNITGNSYWPLNVGEFAVFKGLDGKDSIRVEIRVTDSIKVIQGVDCRVVRDQGFLNGELEEDTYDWYAQDVDGNVWYFGEFSEEIENGVPVSTAGSWEAGVDGAYPGIVMFANPVVGTWYRQEFLEGEAEDVAQILSVGETYTVPYGTFTNCLRTLEYSPLEPKVQENKIYAPGVGFIRAEKTKGGNEYEELVSID